jgi:DNA-binding NtrC family response regulator
MMMRPLSPEAMSRIATLLERRRDAGMAAELPEHWLLDSSGVKAVVDLARRLALAPGAPILIKGERGTGVPELARLIHDADPIARVKPFRSLPAHLVRSSEMRGAAPVGTLFIEDIEQLLPAGQRWLSELLAMRTEAAEPLRIIAGSQLSADDLRRQIGLSQELLHAMDVGRLTIPPLRDRIEDILPLARRFLGHAAGRQARPKLYFSPAAENRLLSYRYPANVRELRNLVERAAALASANEISEEAIVVFEKGGASTTHAGSARAATTGPSVESVRPLAVGRGPSATRMPTLADVERDYLISLIRVFKGRRVAISQAMGVSYPTVLKKIAHHGLDVRRIVESTTTPVDAG